MLHNTGPYGPNDGQINMGAPVNMSQGPGVNIGHSLNNLSKIAHPPPQSPGGQFLLPEYANYGQLPPNMSTQMHQFQGYHHMGFHQNFSPQTHAINHNTHWNNGMLPMNLNIQNEHNVNMESFHQSFEKSHVETSVIKDQPNKIMPINIPQIQTKAFHKQGNVADNYLNDNYNNFYDNNLDLRMRSHEKIHLDETRRKSLENTVKLIENILINTTAKREAQINKQDTKQTDSSINRHTVTSSSNFDFKQPMNNLQQQPLTSKSIIHTEKQAYNLQTNKQAVNNHNILNMNIKNMKQNMSIDNLYKDINSTKIIQENRSIQIDISKTEVNHNKALQDNDRPYTENTSQEKAINFTNHKYIQENDTQLINNQSTQKKVMHFSDDETLHEKYINYTDDKYLQENKTNTIDNESSKEGFNQFVDQNSYQPKNVEDTENKSLQETNICVADKRNTKTRNREKVAPFAYTLKSFEHDKTKNKDPKTADGVNTSKSKSDKCRAVFMEISPATSNDDTDVEDMVKEITEINDKQTEDDPLGNSHVCDETEEDVKPNIKDISTDQQIVTNVVVKIETNVEDGDMGDPFLKDMHGVTRDGVEVNCDIIEAEKSVDEAKDAIKNGQNCSSYYECPHCSLLLKNPKRFLIHTKWHAFGLTQALKEEMRREKQMRRNERREARVIKHMNSKEVTVQENVSGKLFPCNDCDKIFSTKGSLKNHRQRFHPPRSRDCRICHMTITGWNAMRAHMATHVIQTSEGYQCTECPKKFKYMHSLVKHKGTHMEKTHPCPECPKMFGSEILVKMHMKSHERVQRGATFRCTYCGKGFFESYNLTVHERTHRNERPFSCDICNTSFGTKSSLKRHLKVSHNSLKPFECPECHRCFVTEAIRDRHLSRNHGKPEDFKFPCELCPCKYLKQKDLQKHEYKVHPRQTLGKRKRRPKGSRTPKVKMDEDETSD